MAPRQKTFELIPDLPGPGLNGLAQQTAQAPMIKPPMTTKQAKKLHRQANKGPKLSKAEQRRLDLMEQDRIRKEFEKEKAQARARTARDRKKEKQERERDARRKKGLPLVDVHPSQDTISRFVSRMGMGRKRQSPEAETRQPSLREASIETDVETATEAGSVAEGETETEHDDDGPPDKENQDPRQEREHERQSKRIRLSQPDQNAKHSIESEPRRHPAGAVAKIAQEIEAESHTRASSVETDDPATESLLQNQLMSDIVLASSTEGAKPQSQNRNGTVIDDSFPLHVLTPQTVSAASKAPSPPLQSLKSREQQHIRSPVRQKSQTSNAATRSDVQRARNHDGSHFRKPAPPKSSFVKTPLPDGHVDPPKFKTPTVPQASRSNGPRFLPATKHLQSPGPRRPQHFLSHNSLIQPVALGDADPPTSTQLFLFNHVDDFFPSPTQEAEELSVSAAADAALTSTSLSMVASNDKPLGNRSQACVKEQSAVENSQNLRQMPPPPLPKLPKPAAETPVDAPFISTQDFIISSQDFREIDSPCKSGNFSNSNAAPPNERNSSAKQTHSYSSAKVNKDEPQAFDESKAHASANSSNLMERGLALGQRAGFLSTDNDSYRVASTLTSQRNEKSRGSHVQASPPQSKGPTSKTKCQRVDKDTDTEPKNYQGRRSKASSSQHSWARQYQTTSLPRLPSQRPDVGVNRNENKPRDSPPKKRMFGSSGPGAEVLVAMERSYQQVQLQERAREQREQREMEQREMEQREMDRQRPMYQDKVQEPLEEFGDFDGDDLLIGGEIGLDVGGKTPDTCSGSGSGKSGADDTGNLNQALVTKVDVPPTPATHSSGEFTGLAASQETDYGDFDFDTNEALSILEDTTWLDEDLDEDI